VGNWDKNNAWVQQVIIQNVTSLQMNHIGSKVTTESMYAALVDTHDNKAHQTVNHIQTLLYEMKASETNDILKHLDVLKSYRDRLNKFPNTEFHVYDTRFKLIISALLPLSWQSYIEPYNGNMNNPHDPDPKQHMSSDAFIGLLHEEYRIRGNHISNRNRSNINDSTNLVTNQANTGPSTSLKTCIDNMKTKQSLYCNHCKRAGHWTSQCHKNPVNRCHNYSKIGHCTKDCRGKKRDKDKDKSKEKGKGKATDQMNLVDEEITFVLNEEAYNFNTFEVYSANANDEHLIYYDWLADNATMSHVSSQRDIFMSYTPLNNTMVMGVGGKEANITGKGTVELTLTCKRQNYLLCWENILHIPGQ
jgi:hypothetical protein